MIWVVCNNFIKCFPATITLSTTWHIYSNMKYIPYLMEIATLHKSNWSSQCLSANCMNDKKSYDLHFIKISETTEINQINHWITFNKLLISIIWKNHFDIRTFMSNIQYGPEEQLTCFLTTWSSRHFSEKLVKYKFAIATPTGVIFSKNQL